MSFKRDGDDAGQLAVLQVSLGQSAAPLRSSLADGGWGR